MGKIRDVDGIAKHLGKHLPYVVKAPERLEPGLLPLAWGDPSKGHAKHPNAPRSADNPEGHWYDWIRIAPEGEPAEEVITRFDNWPNTTTGLLLGMDGGDPADDSGKNTVYIPRRPVSTKSGDWVRIWAHCLTHGEYVDFVQIP
jgi:hypothetical protein